MFALRQRVFSYRHPVVRGLALVMVGLFAASAVAQNYKTIPTLPRDESNRIRNVAITALRNPAGLGANEKEVDTYLKREYFAQMTQYSDTDLARLGSRREDIFKKLIPQAGNAATQQYLIELTFNVARVMARDNYHPAVRYNAVLMLGDLDQQLATGTNPPVPNSKATAELLELIEQDEINKIPVPESVKLGALVGLERHTRYGIDPALNDRLTTAMLKVIASPTPQDVDKNVHDWVRSSGAAVLINQAKNGPTKDVQAALTALITDKKMELDDRCTVAGLLKTITYPAGADIDGAAAVSALGQLTLDVLTEAAKLAEEYQQEALGTADFSSLQGGRRGGYGGGYGRGEYGGGYGDEADMGPRFERRQVFARLFNIAIGGNALKPGLDDEAKGRVEALIATFGPAIQVMEDNKATEVEVSDEVLNLRDAVASLVNGWGQDAAAAPAEALSGT